MKILSQSRTVWTLQRTCLQCDAVLEIEKTDVYFLPYIHEYCFRCGACDHKNTIPSVLIPAAVQQWIRVGYTPA